MGAMRFLRLINDDVYVCILMVYSDVFKKYTSHSFVYDSHFAQLEKSEWCGAIIDNIYFAPICLPEEK